MALVEFAAIRIDEDRARAYVLARGGLREKARLEGIFGATGPDRQVVKELEALQNADGGFPVGGQPGAPSSVVATCHVLAEMCDMPPLAGSPSASRAVAFLRRTQLSDGSWLEPPQTAALAAGQAGQSPSALTADATYTILTLEPEHQDPIRRAETWLRRKLAGDQGGNETSTRTLGLAWAIWYRQLGARAHEVGWAFHHLSRRELTPTERAANLSLALDVSAGGRFTVSIVQALAKLAAAQQEDGSWDGSVGTTLVALRVFRGYGVI